MFCCVRISRRLFSKDWGECRVRPGPGALGPSLEKSGRHIRI